MLVDALRTYGYGGLQVAAAQDGNASEAGLQADYDSQGGRAMMAYQAEISRSTPACLLFVLDASTSMRERVGDGPTKARFLADAINRLLATLVVTATKADGVRDYFEVGAIHYSTFGARNALVDQSDRNVFRPISTLAHHPLRIEERRRLRAQAKDGIEYEVVRMPIWIEPLASGWTRMCAGLELAHQVTRQWARDHPTSYPPTVIHVTDGHPTDGDPLPLADEIRSITTRDGSVLLFNLHIDTRGGMPIVFPSTARQLPDSYA